MFRSEGKLICSPDQTNESCQWTLFGWNIYHSCGYNKQKINEHLCIIKRFDGLKSIFVIKMNLSSTDQYCFQFKYLITGFTRNSCMNFYGKTLINTKNQSILFSTFCIPDEQIEMIWYSFSVSLPINITIINVVTESNGTMSNQSLIIKDLSIQKCHLINSTIISYSLVMKENFWIKYRWIFIIFVFISIAVFVYMAYQRFNKKSNVIQRIEISSVHRSQHFYEEPVSIILQPSIDINARTKDHDNVIKIPVPDVAKARKAAYSHQQQPNLKVVPSIPVISLHPSSNSTINTVQKLPTFETKPIQSASINSTVWDLDEINEFTQNMFRNNNDNKDNLKPRSYRLRLNCPIDPDDYLKQYIQARSHCLDIFEEYVNSLKRQHGMIKSADSDPPIFDPGISVTGPQVKKETSVIDKEDSHVIKKLNRAEPRKKYALVHEQIGIFIIGGYNLYSDIPVQKEPNTDYLFKFNGDVVEIPPLKPCRIHFGE
ncbi:unnamed protein product [Adineta steineri]|uniref:Uncharacterized protein n=1 Tax=Adineta steineri TaxID=433720 RepID=A0A819EBU5_9BILA|nr:unnamed protein product [Adineta steineri]